MSGAPVTLVDTTNTAISMATAAKQPALGTAGTASTDVLTVQGIASGTPLFVDQTKQTSLVSIPAGTSFTRPADTTAYAIGDLVANSTTAGSVVALTWTGATITGSGGSGEIAAVTVRADSAAATVRVHFFTYAPTVSNGDNGNLVVSNFASTTSSYYVGYFDVVLQPEATIAGGGILGQSVGGSIPYKLASADSLYALVEARTIFTPTSAGVYIVTPRLRRFS